jgi:hypothetical protein
MEIGEVYKLRVIFGFFYGRDKGVSAVQWARSERSY